MTEEAKELHRIISASVRDMLDAYRICDKADPGGSPSGEAGHD